MAAHAEEVSLATPRQSSPGNSKMPPLNHCHSHITLRCALQGAHSTRRRDEMLAWQHHFQAVWEQEKLFEANAPAEGPLLASLPSQMHSLCHACMLPRMA